MMLNSFKNFYRNKTVLITGNTGFKGAWLSLWLCNLGAKVYGYSAGIPTQPSLYELLPGCAIETCFGDINDQKFTRDFFFLKRIEAENPVRLRCRFLT